MLIWTDSDGPSFPVFDADVHPDDDADRVHESECLGVSGDALHTESLRHHLPPGAERAETQAQLQGCGSSHHHVLTPLAEIHQWQAERRDQDRTRQDAVAGTSLFWISWDTIKVWKNATNKSTCQNHTFKNKASNQSPKVIRLMP